VAGALRTLEFLPRLWRRRGPPVHLTLFVTGRCNAKCRHCFYWKEVDAGEAGLALSEIEALGRSAGPLLWLALGGGEPTLREDLPGIVRAFARSRPIVVSVPTNGFLPERAERLAGEISRRNPDSLVVFAVSFEGPEAVHDRVRDFPGGFARAVETVGRLRALRDRGGAANLGVGAIFTLTAENQDLASDFVEFVARELRPDNLTINLARGSPRDPGLLKVDPARYRAAVARKAALVREERLPYFRMPLARLGLARDAEMHERIAAFSEARARGDLSPIAFPGTGVAPRGAVDGRGLDGAYVPCRAGELSLVVDERGEVRPCEILGASFGSLREVGMDLRRLLEGPRAESVRRWIRESRCACTFECAAATNLLFDPRGASRVLARALRS
jgi:MoaA/NifB/PqqE/SkfB family radical SAM enzyme